MSQHVPQQIRYWTWLSAAWLLTGPWPASAIDPSAIVERIAFGSCCNQKRSQVIWPTIAAQKPQLFLFLGDNIYGDSEDMEVLRAKYDELNANPGYAALREICPVLATWDDHDYGANDAGAEFPQREASQKLFLEAFRVAKDRAPWQRPGIYDSYLFGPPGQRVQIILLDTRYFRGPLRKGGGDWPKQLGPYQENLDPSSTMLGDAQWEWLEAQLKEPAELRIIGSSIQFLPVDTHWERWQNLPLERARLLELLKADRRATIILLSGDRHLGELMQSELAPGQTLFEATSSGLSHAGGGQNNEPNRFRTGPLFRHLNFGTIEISWTQSRPDCTIAIRDANGNAVSLLETNLSRP